MGRGTRSRTTFQEGYPADRFQQWLDTIEHGRELMLKAAQTITAELGRQRAARAQEEDDFRSFVTRLEELLGAPPPD